MLRVGDLGVGRCVASAGDDPDGRRVLHTDAHAEIDVGLDFAGKLAHGIDGEGQRDAVALGELLRPGVEVGERFDRHLVGEDVIAIVVAQLYALGVEEACVDGCLTAPDMAGNKKVVANPGNLILGGCSHELRVGLSAQRAFEIVKLHDGDFCAGGRLESGRVVDRCGRRRAELGMGHGAGESRGGKKCDKSHDKPKTNTVQK